MQISQRDGKRITAATIPGDPPGEYDGCRIGGTVSYDSRRFTEEDYTG